MEWIGEVSIFPSCHDIHIVHGQVFLCQTHNVFGGTGTDLVDSPEIERVILPVIEFVFQGIGLGENTV